MAELMGTLLYANTFTADCIRIVTESAEFARVCPICCARPPRQNLTSCPRRAWPGS